jgi:septal ring factor EnvC (AmiA/AmiB activator)
MTRRARKTTPEAPTNIAAAQDNQIQVLRGLLEDTRKETDELLRVKADLSDALAQLKAFRDQHREREAAIESLLERAQRIAGERAHLVLVGTELVRDVRYMFRQCDRIVNPQPLPNGGRA